MNLLDDIITYVRRKVKVPSNESLSSNLIIDYINRFWIHDLASRIELNDLRQTYELQTFPGRNKYNVPLYNVNGYVQGPQPGNQVIAPYPVYTNFTNAVRSDNYELAFYQERDLFFKHFSQPLLRLNRSDTASSATNTYSFTLNRFPILPGHVDITGIIAAESVIDPIVATTLNTNVPKTSIAPSVFISATGANNSQLTVTDSGQFLAEDQNYGLLIDYVNNASLGTYSTTSNTVNYRTGEINVTFPSALSDGTDINTTAEFYTEGLPRGVLLYNNTFTVLPPPDKQYTIKLEGYLSPAAFLNTAKAISFGWMGEYIACGAARKILADTGDVEQFTFYETIFREQEMLVWKRMQRQTTATRTPTIYSTGGPMGYSECNYGAAT